MQVMREAAKACRSAASLGAFCAGALIVTGCTPDTINGYFEVLPAMAESGGPNFGPPVAPPVNVPGGIAGGHFDVDTATTGMPFPLDGGNTTCHTHEYDKVNHTTTVDFFNLSNKSANKEAGTTFDQIQSTLAPTKRFYLFVVNAGINPGGLLQINSTLDYVTKYQNIPQSVLASGVQLSAYTIGKPKTVGDVQLTSLSVAFNSTIAAKWQLNPTSPDDCVIPDLAGPNGEYRNGALVIQAVDADTAEIDPTTGAASSKGSMLWEGIVYYHLMTINADGSESDPHHCY